MARAAGSATRSHPATTTLLSGAAPLPGAASASSSRSPTTPRTPRRARPPRPIRTVASPPPCVGRGSTLPGVSRIGSNVSNVSIRRRPDNARLLARPENRLVRLRTAVTATMLVAAGLGASCNGSGRAVSDPPANGGFSGTKAALYEYAYAHCLRFGSESARSHPTGSNPTVYDMRAAYPVVMIGTIKPHGPAQWRAAKDGCAV